MRARAALILLTIASPGLLAAVMFGGAGLVWLGVPMICGLPILLIVIGDEGRQPPRGGLLALWLLLTGSWLGIAWLSVSTDLAHPSVGEAIAVMGLMLLGLGLVPILLVGWLFARSFRTEGLSPSELARLPGGGDP